jgi:hypothetical protein
MPSSTLCVADSGDRLNGTLERPGGIPTQSAQSVGTRSLEREDLEREDLERENLERENLERENLERENEVPGARQSRSHALRGNAVLDALRRGWWRSVNEVTV